MKQIPRRRKIDYIIQYKKKQTTKSYLNFGLI